MFKQGSVYKCVKWQKYSCSVQPSLQVSSRNEKCH